MHTVTYLRFLLGILAICSWNTCDSLLTYLRLPLNILAIWSWHSVGILAILALEYLRYCAQAVPLALHTCDFVKHTCEKNRKYGFTRNIASMTKIASTHEKIAYRNRKYGGAGILKSQVCHGILAIFSIGTCDIFPLWWNTCRSQRSLFHLVVLSHMYNS